MPLRADRPAASCSSSVARSAITTTARITAPRPPPARSPAGPRRRRQHRAPASRADPRDARLCCSAASSSVLLAASAAAAVDDGGRAGAEATTMAPSQHQQQQQHHDDAPDPLPAPLRNALRSAEFFVGFSTIYGSYKAAQLRAAALRAAGASDEEVRAKVWEPQHAWAGDRMHALCVSLRGFYLKAGQFIGARGDFVPEPVCRRLALLQDRVPPMPAARAAAVLKQELGVDDLSRVFEWIDLETPLGSASVSQVHKARLRRLDAGEAARILRRAGGARGAAAADAAAAHAAAASSSSSSSRLSYVEVALAPGETAWSVANDQGVGLAELAAANPGVRVERAREGDVLRVPLPPSAGGGEPWAAAYLGLAEEQGGAGGRRGSRFGPSAADGFAPVFSAGGRRRAAAAAAAAAGGAAGASAAGALDTGSSSDDDRGDGNSNGGGHAPLPPPPHALVALARASALGALPSDRVVAVKVQYPSAEAQMAMDLRNIRGAAAFLRQTGEIPFDLVSAVDELKTQIAYEFDFTREARVMDTIALHLAASASGPGTWSSGAAAAASLVGGAASAVASAAAAPVRAALRRLLQVGGGGGGNSDATSSSSFSSSATTTTAPLSASAPARVRVPRSVPGLVTRRVLAMEFVEGVPLLQLADKVSHLPRWQRERAARRVLERVSEAYGRMILGEGLFQADGHPGNILVTPGGGVALLDYGQSKQLPRREQVAFARIVAALDRNDTAAVDRALDALGVETERRDVALRREMAFGMFDTRGKVDPFDKSSPIKQCAITRFPPDLFFVLRVVQLLRGMANGMGIEDFSSASQWAPLARRTLRQEERRQQRGEKKRTTTTWRSAPIADVTALAVPLQLHM